MKVRLCKTLVTSIIFSPISPPSINNKFPLEKQTDKMKGTLDCKFLWYPKFYNHVVLFFHQKTLGTIIKFWLVSSDFQTIILFYKRDNFILSFLVIYINLKFIALYLKIRYTNMQLLRIIYLILIFCCLFQLSPTNRNAV